MGYADKNINSWSVIDLWNELIQEMTCQTYFCWIIYCLLYISLISWENLALMKSLVDSNWTSFTEINFWLKSDQIMILGFGFTAKLVIFCNRGWALI